MARLISCILLPLAMATAALGCAVPHGGCRASICASYEGITGISGIADMGDYSDPDTWTRGHLPLVGFYLGNYNENYNGGLYQRKGVKDTPALNLERFDLEAEQIDPNTGKPFATPSSETTLAACCDKCRVTDGCYLFQFIPPESVADPAAPVCYLLSGGTVQADLPGYGTPLAGTKKEQITGERKDIPMSFVGGRCNGTEGVKDDPHFTGAHGVRFDFNGELEKSFCLVSDARVHVNALLRGYRDSNPQGATVGADGKALRTWIRELAFLWRDAQEKTHQLHLVARSGKQQERGSGFLASATLDGKPVALPSAPGALRSGELALEFLGTATRGAVEVDRYWVRIAGLLDLSLDMRVAHPQLQSPSDAEAHFNLLFNDLRATGKVHGVLGQTYRSSGEQLAKAAKYSQIAHLLGAPIQADGESGRGFLEGEVKDYVTSSVLSPDCKFQAF